MGYPSVYCVTSFFREREAKLMENGLLKKKPKPKPFVPPGTWMLSDYEKAREKNIR